MEAENPDEAAPVRKTLAGRAYLALQAMLRGEWRPYLTSGDYISGVAKERDAALGRLERTGWVLLGVVAFLLMSIAGIKVDLTIWGNQISRFPLVVEATTLVCSLLHVRFVAELINVTMLNRYLIEIAKALGQESPHLLIAPYSGRMASAEALAIRLQGYTSWPAIISILLYFLLYAVPLILTYALVPAATVAYASWQAVFVFGTPWVGTLGLALAAALTAGTLTQLLLFYLLPFRYKLRPINLAEIKEQNRARNAETLQRLRSRFSRSGHSGQG